MDFNRPRKNLILSCIVPFLWLICFTIPVNAQSLAFWEDLFPQESAHAVQPAAYQQATGQVADVHSSPIYIDQSGTGAIGGEPVWTTDESAYTPRFDNGYWLWQILPDGLIWHNYMAGVHEARISGVAASNRGGDAIFDVSLGGRVGLLRFGSTNTDKPEGWQLDMEGVAFPRLNIDRNFDVDATDFRFGIPLTYGLGNWQYKFAYYHLSSHLGDEYIIRNGSAAERINYSRDALTLAASHFFTPAARLYAEAQYAFHTDGGNQPWEFQFGIDYAQPGRTDIYGTPFVAVNGHVRESVDFSGNLVAQAGWLWRGDSGRTLRAGFHYYNGKSNQYEFFDKFEEQVGFGIWYDQ